MKDAGKMLVVFLKSILKKSNLLHMRSIPVIIFLLILWSAIFKLKLLRDGNNFFHVVSDARCLISPILKVLFAKIFNLQYQKTSIFLLLLVELVTVTVKSWSVFSFFFIFQRFFQCQNLLIDIYTNTLKDNSCIVLVAFLTSV